MKKIDPKFIGTLLFAVFTGMIAGQNATLLAQEPSTDLQKQKIAAIYEATKTVETAKDYSQFLDQCEQALASELSEKNRAYVTSLTGWALNRRGVLRLETAEQFKKVGSNQADEAMSAAMSDFDKSVAADPRRWRSWMSRGIAQVFDEHFGEAVEDFTKVIELKPDEVNAWFNRAEANFHHGRFESAIADYGAVLAMKAQDLESHTGRGHAYFALARFSDALQDYEFVSRLSPNNAAAAINLGDVYQRIGRWEEAESCYANAIKDESNAVARQRFAWFKATCPNVDLRDANLALALIEMAIELAGETPVNLDTLAAVQAAKGNFEFARTTQQKVIQLTAANSETTEAISKDYKNRMAMYEEGVAFEQD